MNRDAGGQGPGAGRVEGLHHQPRHLPRRHPVTAEFVIGAYHRLFQIEALVPDVQARPGRPADLPPQARVDRGPPDHRVRRARRRPAASRSAPAGRSASSCAPPAATAPSRSAPAPQLLTAARPPPRRPPRRPRARSPGPTVRTNLSQVRSNSCRGQPRGKQLELVGNDYQPRAPHPRRTAAPPPGSPSSGDVTQRTGNPLEKGSASRNSPSCPITASSSTRCPAPAEPVPLLQIAPSKTDTERLLVISPELADVFAAVIRRIRGRDGALGCVASYDSHERVWNPPMPVLFQRRFADRTPRHPLHR